MYAYHSTNDDFDNDDLCPSWLYRNFWLELVQYNFMFDITPDGRPPGSPEMPFLKHKDQYEYPNGDY